MTTETPESEIATQLASINQRLANLGTEQGSVTAAYKDAYSKYVKELEKYAADRVETGRSRVIASVLRMVVVVILIYIAYRVS